MTKPSSSATPAQAPNPIGQAAEGHFGRIPVTHVFPVIAQGAYPIKAVVDEAFPVRANVFREGHDAVSASVVLTSPTGVEQRVEMVQQEPIGLDIWEAWVRPDAEGEWTFRVEGWSDPWHTWHHNAVAKLPLEIDVELVCLEGKALLERTAVLADAAKDSGAATVLRATASVLLPSLPIDELLEKINSKSLARVMGHYAPRDLVSPTAEYPVRVDRHRALFGSWYEFFPRSQGAYFDQMTQQWVSGTFDKCHERLEAAAAMGFDVVYLPPIHPIGEAFKKGKNNTLDAHPDDPGSPWAIGSDEGGHDAVHPDLGTLADFDRLVAKAHELNLEVALDFALQASPNHPWLTSHPDFFTTRADGTIAYAENPPKKYQDIYPINFDNNPEGIYHEALRLVNFWIDHGVTIFRVDNPHTKPLNFWEWLLAEVRKDHPEVVFLAEAFTRPAMMQALGAVGFHQGYSYFTWRNTKQELEEYLSEVAHDTAHAYRPNFFVNTPDINPAFLQTGNPAAFSIRAILAATMAPSWGVYSGFELFEHAPLRVGGEEYLNSEKYEYRPRNFTAEPNLNMLLGKLNQIRRDHPALQQLRNTRVQVSESDDIIAFTKVDGNDRVIVVVSLQPDWAVESEVQIDMASLGLDPGWVLKLHDELTGAEFTWGPRNFVRLTPGNPAHILSVETA